MSRVEEWILENKDKIEMGVDLLGKGCEILAATVGQFHPILEAVFTVSAELLGNAEISEAKYLAKQFESVHEKMLKIQGDLEKTELALMRSSVNMENFKFYAQIINQYEMFKYIFTAKPKFKKLKIEEFIEHFEIYEGEKNLDCIYNAIIGESPSREPMLDTLLKTEERSRRALEEFCASLKVMFVVGVIALMGYAALKDGGVEEDVVEQWKKRMEIVETRMKEAVDECVNKFAEQAKIDIDQKLLDRQSSVDSEFTQFVLGFLVEKYDWVSWSVRVFKDDGGIKLLRFMRSKRRHVNSGVNYFEHLSKNKIRIVVSFTADPKQLDKNQIKDEIEETKGDLESVVESLSNSFPDCLVHGISRSNEVVEANNFDPNRIYYIVHKKGYICIHSE